MLLIWYILILKVRFGSELNFNKVAIKSKNIKGIYKINGDSGQLILKAKHGLKKITTTFVTSQGLRNFGRFGSCS